MLQNGSHNDWEELPDDERGEVSDDELRQKTLEARQNKLFRQDPLTRLPLGDPLSPDLEDERNEIASERRRGRRTSVGRRRHNSEGNKKLDLERIRENMRWVPVLLDSAKIGAFRVGHVNVESLTWCLYREFGLGSRADWGDFMNDIQQQMALIILTMDHGHTLSYYSDLARKQAKNFVQTGAFNADVEGFGSRKGYDADRKRFRLVFKGRRDLLESGFYELDDDPTEDNFGVLKLRIDYSSGEKEKPISGKPDSFPRSFALKPRAVWHNRLSKHACYARQIQLMDCRGLSRDEIERDRISEDDWHIVRRVLDQSYPFDIDPEAIENVTKKANRLEGKLRVDEYPFLAFEHFIVSQIGGEILKREIDKWGNVISTVRLCSLLYGAIRMSRRCGAHRDWRGLLNALDCRPDNLIDGLLIDEALAYEEYWRDFFERAERQLYD